MISIITMAGLGSRFKKAGYSCPKYMIEAKGKTLFEWSMDSMIDYNEFISKYIFVVRREDNAKQFILDKCLQYNIKKVEVIEIDYLTDGQSNNVLFSSTLLQCEESIMIYNIDTYIEPYQLKYKDIKGDGYIPCFNEQGDHWSFVRTNENGNVIEIREKKRISNNCTLGAYYFSSAKLYKKLYDEYYKDDNNMEKNEKYIAPLYNYMVQLGMNVTMSIVDRKKVHVLGTPDELNAFLNEQ